MSRKVAVHSHHLVGVKWHLNSAESRLGGHLCSMEGLRGVSNRPISWVILARGRGGGSVATPPPWSQKKFILVGGTPPP